MNQLRVAAPKALPGIDDLIPTLQAATQSPPFFGLQNHQQAGVVGQAFEAESGEMNQTGLRESLARESVIDASRHVALPGSLEGIGLSTPRRFIPEVTPAKGVNPFNELRAPLLILRRVGVEVADHEGALTRIHAHPWLELLEGLPLLSLGRHVDG